MVDTNISSYENIKSEDFNIIELGTASNNRSLFFDENSTRIKKPANPYSTNTVDLVGIQLNRYKELMPNPYSFTNLLHHTVFEDGMSNAAIEIVKRVYKREPFMTVTWLYQLYGMNQQDSEIINGIIRIIAFLEVPATIAPAIIPMLRLALIDETIHCQESAIMLCEVWRTNECLEALKSAKFSDSLLRDYANNIISEISNELIANAS